VPILPPVVGPLCMRCVAGLPRPDSPKEPGLVFVIATKDNNSHVIRSPTTRSSKDLKTSRARATCIFNADHCQAYGRLGDDDGDRHHRCRQARVIGKLSTGSSPETFGIDEKRRRIYVSNERAPRSRHRHGPELHHPGGRRRRDEAVISEDGHHVYVTSEVGLSSSHRRRIGQCGRRGGGTRPRRFAPTPAQELWCRP